MATTKTFYERAFERFTNRAGGAFRRGIAWYRNARDYTRDVNEQVVDWVTEHRKGIIIGIGTVVFVGVTILFFVDLSRGEIEDPGRVGLGGIIGGPLLGLVVGAISAVLIYFSLWLVDKILLLLIYVLLMTPILIGAIFYGLGLLLIVVSQFLLLVPLSILTFLNGLWLLWRRIFYTCPNRLCAYRGLPIHVCPRCGREHGRLWPNLYGVFYHPCTCGHRLPTLDILGRSNLVRLCTDCRTELSVVGLPEELVALAGATSVGKTTFLLSSIQSLQEGDSKRLKTEAVVPQQQEYLEGEITKLKHGTEPAKTDFSLAHAYLLRLERESRQTLLFYYDAAGEVFSSIDSFTNQKVVKYLDGLILLVDPFSLEGLCHEVDRCEEGIRPSPTPFIDVVAGTIATLHKARGSRNRNSILLAVVITKADAQPVKAVLGDVTYRLPTSDKCKDALINWGAGNSLQLLHQNFKTIRYFACSALGRSPDIHNRSPFKAYGVLEPLAWILEAQ
jgi:hypothetical protein